MSAAWALARGASVCTDRSARFAVWAPRASRVAIRVVSPAPRAPVPLAAAEGGMFCGTIADAPPGTDYVYRLDCTLDVPDPVSRHQPAGVHGPSRVVDPGAFSWSDASWPGLDPGDLVLYELHVGTFSEAGTFAGVLDRFAQLRELGVTAIELMPVAEFPGRRNWGYDGVHLYAPHDSYGGPAGLRRLVDAAHGVGLGVVLDVVYNHLGPEGNYLGRFGPYFTDRYRTPWGDAINFDGPDSDEVRRYFVENALYWITEYHVDGLRLDAVHAIYDFGARHILAELSAAVHAQGAALGRRAFVIAESALNDPRVVRDPDRGGWGLDAQWNDDFHHAVHAALTGERSGYYADFGDVALIAKALRERFVLDGGYSRHHRRHHGAPATDVPAERFVVAIQTHDQVGNRPRGERLAALVLFEAAKLAAAALLLSPYVPLLFMGEESGETNPFLYFVSHGDPVLLDAVREGRRRELEWGANESVPDPASEDTFRRSRIDWEAAERDPTRTAIGALYRDLLRLRATEPALRVGTAEVAVRHDAEAPWVTLLLTAAGAAPLCAAFNFGAASADAIPPRAAPWRVVLSTADSCYGGPGPAVERDGGVTLPPWSAALCRPEPD